jgi:hypothetical protein
VAIARTRGRALLLWQHNYQWEPSTHGLLFQYENLAFWTRSKVIGSTNDIKRVINPKHEIRNPKQYPMTKIQMFQTIAVLEVANKILFLAFGNLIFEFVSDFDIRISNFAVLPA